MNFKNRALEYNKYRKADYRLTKKIVEILNLDKGSIIADIGAGTGNYSLELINNGFFVYAIEPCLLMKEQCADNRIKWIDSAAELISLPDHSVDGAIIINAIHHFEDLRASLNEVKRILKPGPLVILTFDPLVAQKYWLFDYWPQLRAYEKDSYLDISTLCSILNEIFGTLVKVDTYEIPWDFIDVFSAAIWRRPEILLREGIRNSMSVFSSISMDEFLFGLNELENDLKNEKWNEKYGNLLEKENYDVGCRLIYLYKE